jgi:hypothetical protein
MSQRTLFILIGAVTVLSIAGIIALALVLTPEDSNPAFDVATRFMNAAGLGENATAFALLTPSMQDYVTGNCPDGSVSACIYSYTPSDWGRLLREGAAIFRRATPDGDAWDVQIVATYEEGEGFSGVCIYHRMEEIAPDNWRVAAWSGFISCDDPDSRIESLRRADAANRAP